MAKRRHRKRQWTLRQLLGRDLLQDQAACMAGATAINK
jgi:hypothetical protein